MAKDPYIKYDIAIKKSEGYFSKLKWGLIPAFHKSGLNVTQLKTIDEFTTSTFQNEKELIAFMIRYADLIDLEIAIYRDKLADITTGFLLKCLEKIGSSVSSRKIIIEIGNYIGVNNVFKRMLREGYHNGQSFTIKEQIEEIFRDKVYNAVQMDQNLTSSLKEALLDEIAKIEIPSPTIRDLLEYAKNSKPVYDIGRNRPIVIIRSEAKPNSPKFKQSEVYGGVAYLKDSTFLDVTNIKMILHNALDKPDHALLQDLLKIYGYYDNQRANAIVIKDYLKAKKNNLPCFVEPAKRAINDLIEKEISIINKKTGQIVTDEKGYPILNYLGLRRLGMCISQLVELQHTRVFPLTLEQRLQEIDRKNQLNPEAFTKQIGLLQDFNFR